ncbi:ureidoglycolate lyase [Lachnotalea glycerini]|uniref:Ureidoglycolate lyase n=1 Tax=Lachnotalea glycerini TaxID=1763509 RepID=A0A318EKU6_9FIRM|nr:ureidoglycolate lyase [Lachnotalea glycerini]OYO76167.1 ureidoglycolate hydrolase [Lachnotalea glycerini]PXV87719.1 ureidoglycolate lyase [Lachnotalea glycerini]
MRIIKANPLTKESFAPYGEYASIQKPTGNHIGSFYPDQVHLSVSGDLPVAFSPLVCEKSDKMIITTAEFHNTTAEGLLVLDDDVVLHVAPPSKDPVPELTEAFIVPQGTMIKLNIGVWHFAAMPINKDKAHVLIVLPERIYVNDCTVVEYDEKDHMEVQI